MTAPTAIEAAPVCPVCNGSRVAAECRRCHGTRKRLVGLISGKTQAALDTGEPCPECREGAAACYACGGTGRLVSVPAYGHYQVSVRPNQPHSGPTFDSLVEARETDGRVTRMERWQRDLCAAAFANPDVRIALDDWSFGRVGEYRFHVRYEFRRAGADSDCVLVSLNRGGDEWEWFARGTFATRVLYQRD